MPVVLLEFVHLDPLVPALLVDVYLVVVGADGDLCRRDGRTCSGAPSPPPRVPPFTGHLGSTLSFVPGLSSSASGPAGHPPPRDTSLGLGHSSPVPTTPNIPKAVLRALPASPCYQDIPSVSGLPLMTPGSATLGSLHPPQPLHADFPHFLWVSLQTSPALKGLMGHPF